MWIILILLSIALTLSCWLNVHMYKEKATSYLSVSKHNDIVSKLQRERDSFVKQLQSLNSQMSDLHNNMATKADALATIRFDSWKSREEKKIREDALKRSKNVVKGKVSEHLLPLMDKFRYNGKDCRFIGTPIDYIVFDGLDEDSVKEVIFLEVKTGEHAKLTSRERLIRDAIQDGRVRWEVINI